MDLDALCWLRAPCHARSQHRDLTRSLYQRSLVFVVCLLQRGCVDLVSSFSLYLASVTVEVAVLLYAIDYA